MFLWSFWYIIYIFLILYEIVMNFQSIAYFLELWNNMQILIVPRLGLPIVTDPWVLATSAAMLAVDRVKMVDPAGAHRRRAGERRRRRYRASPDPWLQEFDSEQQYEPFRGGAPVKWSLERAPATCATVADSGQQATASYS
jgi:hypothetical protein